MVLLLLALVTVENHWDRILIAGVHKLMGFRLEAHLLPKRDGFWVSIKHNGLRFLLQLHHNLLEKPLPDVFDNISHFGSREWRECSFPKEEEGGS